MMTNNDLHIRRMIAQDFELMMKWLNDPKVLEFYEESAMNLEKVKEKFGPRVEGRHYVTPCIIEYQTQPIGYMQYFKIPEDELIRYGYSPNQTIYGIDQFIGETRLWGKGIGTSMIKMMLNYLGSKTSKVALDVKKNNSRAIACYEKCGFRKIKELDHNYYLMEWKTN